MRPQGSNTGNAGLPGGTMPKTLLLADDSVTIQKVVGISLANEDIELVTVDNGDDAVSRAQELRPDIVLADIVMPGKNGYEVCEALKGDPSLAQMPVLLLTGTFEAFDAERARQAGADGHITKPFEAQALVDQVNQLLARSTPMGDDAAAKIDAPPAAAQTPANQGGAAFDFFAGAGGASGGNGQEASSAPSAASAPEETSPFGGADLMSDSGPSVSPGHADETVLLDGSQTAEDPAFDAAVEAAAFDAPGERSFADPDDGDDVDDADELSGGGDLTVGGDSGFDIETADLSMASTVPEVAPPAPDLTFSMASPPQVTDLDAAPASETPDPAPAVDAEPAPAVEATPSAPAVKDLDAAMAAEAPLGTEPPAATPSPDATDPLVSFDLAGPAAGGTPPVAQPETAEPAGADLDATQVVPVSEPVGNGVGMGVGEGFDDAQRGEAIQIDPAGAERFDVEPTQLVADPAPEAEATGGEDTTRVVEDADPLRVQAPADVPPHGTNEPETPAEPSPSAVSDGTGTELPPGFQQQIHASLEKVAWEAFSDLSEQVVKQALAQIEAVAWEVIPKMAETLVREEIERMKAGSEEE